MQENQTRVVYISGKKVNLRPVSKSDIPNFLVWVNDEEIRDLVGGGQFPTTEQDEEKWFAKLQGDRSNIVFVIETKDGLPIGVMGAHKIDWISRVCETGALIGDKDYRGGGYGTDAKMVLLNYLFNTLNIHKVCSAVISYNKRSLHYSMHCGYEIEGVRKKHLFKKGRYWDKVELGLFKKQWLPIWKIYQKTGYVR